MLFAWKEIADLFPGWTLTEIKALTPNERNNWMQVGHAI